MPTRNERVRKAREARRRASVREQERKQAAAEAAAAAVHDEPYDAPRARGAHGTRVYGRRYRPYPDALAGIPSAREAQGSQAHATPSQTRPAAPVVVEEVRVKVAPVAEVDEPEGPKVEAAAPTVDGVGVKGAPPATSTPAPVVEVEVEVEESDATPAGRTADDTVEPATQVQPSEATESDDDTSVEEDASEGESDSEEDEEVLGEEEDHSGNDARHVMPGDFFSSNPPPQSAPGLWPLGATIGVVSAVAFVR